MLRSTQSLCKLQLAETFRLFSVTAKTAHSPGRGCFCIEFGVCMHVKLALARAAHDIVLMYDFRPVSPMHI